MTVTSESGFETSVAMRVAGEDIVPGDFVTVMNEIVEIPSFLWTCSAVSLAPDEPVRIRLMANDAGQPHKVVGVCLPFVYVKTRYGSTITIDTRRKQLVRLEQGCARNVWQQMRGSSKKKKRK